MSTISMTGGGVADAVGDLLAREVPESGLSCELVADLRRPAGGGQVRVLVFEKYYMRAKNRVSLTVLVTGDEGTVHVDAVGSGGGQGPIFSFSWGAEDDFAETVPNILEPQGFRRL